MRLLRQALTESPELLQEELPHLLKLVEPQARDAVLAELVAQAESHDFGELKRLVFAAIAADLVGAAPLRASIEKVFSQDATLAGGVARRARRTTSAWRTRSARCWRMRRNIAAMNAVFRGAVFIGIAPHVIPGIASRRTPSSSLR